MFYTGDGVLNFEGVDYAKGDKLPAGLPAETLDALKAKGKASDSPVAAAVAAVDVVTESLRKQIEQLTESLGHAEAEIRRGSDEIEKLRALLEAERAALEAERKRADEAQVTIEQLTVQLTTAAPAAAGPAPKGSK